MMLSFIFLTIAIAYALPAPDRCVSPRAWEASVRWHDPVTSRAVIGEVGYDSVNQRRTINERRIDPVSDGVDSFLKIYALWRNVDGRPMVYSYNVNTTRCVKAPINFPWRPYGISEFANFSRTTTIGAKGVPLAGVTVNVWRDLQRNPNGVVTGYFEEEFTSVGCVPVRHIFLNVSDPQHDFREDHWYSTTLGIKDPAVFNPPAACFAESSRLFEDGITEDPRTWSMISYHMPVRPSVEPQPQVAPPVCLSPPQWEARASFYDPITTQWIGSNFSYDATNQREFFAQHRRNLENTQDEYVKIWALWKAAPSPVFFLFNENTSVCIRNPLRFPFTPIGVPLNATYRRTATIGTNGLDGAGVDINVWSSITRDSRNVTQLYQETQLTAIGCVPIRRLLVNFTTSPNDYQERHWYDVVPGVKDPAIFTPPAQCINAIELNEEIPEDRALWANVGRRQMAAIAEAMANNHAFSSEMTEGGTEQ